MTKNKFRFKIRSRKGDGDRVFLDDFANEISNFHDTLIKLDKLVSKKRTPTMSFQITDLKYSSPAVVEVEALPQESEADFTYDVGTRFVRGVADIQRGVIPRDFNAALVKNFRRIGASTKHEVHSVEVGFDGDTVTVDKHLDDLIEEALGDDRFVVGAVTGMLESINVHGDKNEFRVYPIAGPTSVKCKFPTELKRQAIKAVDKHVTVRGRLTYNVGEKFPCFVEVSQIDILPSDDKLPTFSDLYGIAPDATGELSSEEFIKRIRSVN